MNPRLEELRKRLMPSETTGSSDAIFTRSSQPAPANRSKQAAISGAEAAEWSSDAQGPAEPIPQQKIDNEYDRVGLDKTHSIDQQAQVVASLFEPARRYRERLSSSLDSIRALHVELGVLSQSVEPLGALHNQIVDFLNAIQGQLADMAKSLEEARSLRLQLSELVQDLDAGSELQSQIYDLSKALSVALESARTKGN
jgi:DNA repair exonuclease SbcCD ATPase subunit